MSKLFIDITQLIEWPGKLTGIPRVMDELSRRFAEEDEAAFVAWHRTEYLLRLVDSRELDRPITTKPQQNPTEGYSIKKLVKMFETRSVIARKVLHYPRRFLHAIRQSSRPQDSPKSIEFIKKGDTLLVLWGDWGNERYIGHIQRLQQQGVRIVQVVYDMLPLVTPQFSGHSTESLGKYVRAIYPISSVLLSISHYTAKDVAAWLKAQKLSVPPIKVIRLGDDFRTLKAVKPSSDAFKKAKLTKQSYILCVGTLEARKNHALLYYTYKLAMQKGIELPKLVIVGRRGWKTDDLYELMTHDPETKDRLVLLENIADNELAWLYQHCLFTIYPSFYEGWGLPIAESIAYGIPCACSNTSSMPEIAGDLLTYFSPVSTDECLAAMQLLLNKKEHEKATRKLKKYKPTSWDQTYNQVKRYIKV